MAASAQAWRDEQTLRRLYLDEELSINEVASEVDCSYETAHRWLTNHGIETRDKTTEPATEACRVQRASYRISGWGYEQWRAREDGGVARVAVHQLLVISEGADPHEVFSDENVVHHKAGEPAMNLSGGFVEVLSRSEHEKTHNANEWTEERGFPVLRSQTGE